MHRIVKNWDWICENMQTCANLCIFSHMLAWKCRYISKMYSMGIFVKCVIYICWYRWLHVTSVLNWMSLTGACYSCCLCRILIYYDGVEVSFDMSGNLPHFKGNKKGRVYLTTHRVRHWLYIAYHASHLSSSDCYYHQCTQLLCNTCKPLWIENHFRVAWVRWWSKESVRKPV